MHQIKVLEKEGTCGPDNEEYIAAFITINYNLPSFSGIPLSWLKELAVILQVEIEY